MTYAPPIHPSGCGCTDCLTGAAVPLDRASRYQLFMALCGWAPILTDEAIRIEISLTLVREDLDHPALPRHRDAVITMLGAAGDATANVRIKPATWQQWQDTQ